MVSKAISGVKRPVLPDREREPATGPNKDEDGGEKDRRREEEWVKRRVLIVKSFFSAFPPNTSKTHIRHREGKRMEL